MKHTSGPWAVGPWHNGKLSIVVEDMADRSFITEVTGYRPEHKANANLIAAAPSLLAALEQSLAVMEAVQTAYPGTWDEEIDQARQVIARAKGEQP